MIGTGATVTSGVSPGRMLSTACGSRRSATSSAELRSSRSDRISERATSTAIAMPTSRPSIRMTELMPARLLARWAAAAAVGGQLGADQPRRAVGALPGLVVGRVPVRLPAGPAGTAR